MVRLLVYGYTTGVRSSRAIERKCVDDVAFRSLAADRAPDFRSIARFRRRHLDALAGLFTQSLHLTQLHRHRRLPVPLTVPRQRARDRRELRQLGRQRVTDLRGDRHLPNLPALRQREVWPVPDPFHLSAHRHYALEPVDVKLRTKTGWTAYSRRKAIVEPVFGQIITCQDGRRLLLRGQDGARGEWRLLAACHNLRKIFRHAGTADSPPWPADPRACGPCHQPYRPNTRQPRPSQSPTIPDEATAIVDRRQQSRLLVTASRS